MCGRQGIISLSLCKVWELEEWLRILDLSANRLNSLPLVHL
jgi:hypothetical protein